MTEAYLHIHAPLPCKRTCERKVCPVCDKRSVILGWFTDWYGWDFVCLRCAREWQDGELMPKPFMPKWWVHIKESARRRWRKGRLTQPEVRNGDL